MASTVVLTVPADAAYVVVLRSATAAAASRIGFSVDQIEDLRLAVDELAALALSQTSPSAELELTLTATGTELAVSLRFAGQPVPEDGFAWMVLKSLAASVAQDATDGYVTVALSAAGHTG